MVEAPEPSCRRDNGEDSGSQRREANKPNSRQAFRYNTKASAAAALPEAEGKKTTDTTRGKVPQSQNHFVRRIIALDLRLSSFSSNVESKKDRLASVS